MIDTLSIISNGGVVLWEHTSEETGRRALVNRLIQEVLLEGRAGVQEFVAGDYRLCWSLENDAQFFVVAVFPKFLSYSNIGSFLRDISRSFAKKYSKVQDTLFAEYDFTAQYKELLSRLRPVGCAEDGAVAAAAAAAAPATHNTRDTDEEEHNSEEDNVPATVSHEEAEETRRSGDVFVTKSGHLIGRKGQRGATQATSAAVAGGKASATASTQKKKPVKQATRWTQEPSDPAVEQQQCAPSDAELAAQVEIQRATFIKRLPNGNAAPVKEREWEGQQRGRLASWLRSYVGRRELDSQDFQKVIPSLREKLIAKNVAVEVAEHVCKSVEASLEGKKLGTFDSLQRSIEDALISALRRILQPKHEVNILRDVAAARARKRPYSIVFCGVNGVGKSTSLAKIAYWLQQNGYSLLVAAGDTFRHGAVEQLEVHGRCLGVPVFQMGYGADPSAVAAAAIAQASRQHYDVVMIDTAGRMQDHEARMRALAKLIHDNQPDLVLFVGEALVGNNGVDQLRRYNQCLVDYAPVGAATRGIDGIVLTKFDTIDDKVGAALSMVYELGQPIVFVGVGQTYQDLKVIEPEVVVSALMQ